MEGTDRVHVADRGFGLFEGFEGPMGRADWSNGLIVPLSVGALVATGIDRGYVKVTVRLLDAEPVVDWLGGWDDIVEVSLHSESGGLRVAPRETHQAIPDLPLLSARGKGWYRIRGHVTGRDAHTDAVREDSEEVYLFCVWPGPKADPLAIRLSDRCGYGWRRAGVEWQGEASGEISSASSGLDSDGWRSVRAANLRNGG